MERAKGSILKGAVSEGKAAQAVGLIGKTDLVSPRAPGASRHDRPHTAQRGRSVECTLVGRVLPGPKWSVEILGRPNESFDAVISTLPARSLSKLAVGSNNECPLSSLDKIEYPPLASLFLGYKREQVRHPLDGFGVLVPAAEKRETLGILFSSSLFRGRAPRRSRRSHGHGWRYAATRRCQAVTVDPAFVRTTGLE